MQYKVMIAGSGKSTKLYAVTPDDAVSTYCIKDELPAEGVLIVEEVAADKVYQYKIVNHIAISGEMASTPNIPEITSGCEDRKEGHNKFRRGAFLSCTMVAIVLAFMSVEIHWLLALAGAIVWLDSVRYRLKNIGVSGKALIFLTILAAVPFVGFFLVLPCLILPEGYIDHARASLPRNRKVLSVWVARSGKILSAGGVWGLLVFLYCLLFDVRFSIGMLIFPPVALAIIYVWWRWISRPKKLIENQGSDSSRAK